MDNQTKAIYFLDGEDTPFMFNISKSSNDLTLSDFKQSLNLPQSPDRYKYVFKVEEPGIGPVKMEVTDDNDKVPLFDNKLIVWLSTQNIHKAHNKQSSTNTLPNKALPTITSSTPNQSTSDGIGKDLHIKSASAENIKQSLEKLSSATKNLSIVKTSTTLVDNKNFNNNKMEGSSKPAVPKRADSKSNNGRFAVPTNLRRFPSDTTLDSTMTDDTYCMQRKKAADNEFFDDASSRYSSMTGSTAYSLYKHRKKQRRKRLPNQMTDSMSSFTSSISNSTVSLNIIIATLDMTKYESLGITLISDQGGGPILVGYVFPTGAIAADGRIQRGDIIIEINGISLEDKNTDEAVEIIREQAKNPMNGTITMTVAKQPLFPNEAEMMAANGNTMPQPQAPGFQQNTTQRNQMKANSQNGHQPSMPIDCNQWVKSTIPNQGQGNIMQQPYASTSSM